jgi:hypothetical protein
VFDNHTDADDPLPSIRVDGRTVVYDPERPGAYVVADDAGVLRW